MKRSSLAASHSSRSNGVLAFLCIVGALGFAGIFAFLGAYGMLPQPAFIAGVAASGAMNAVSAISLLLFKR